MRVEIKETIFVQLKNGNLAKARLRIRDKKASGHIHNNLFYRYLYLVYRDGKKIKEIYLTKLEDQY